MFIIRFQAETYQAEITNDSHGTSGPLKVSFAPDLKNVAENFLEVAAAYDKQRSLIADANEFCVVDKYAVRFINVNGARYGSLKRVSSLALGKVTDKCNYV